MLSSDTVSGWRLAAGRCKTPRGEYKGTKELDTVDLGEHSLTGFSRTGGVSVTIGLRTVEVHTLERIDVQQRRVEFIVIGYELIFGLHFGKRRGLVYRTIDSPFDFGGNFVHHLLKRVQKVRVASNWDKERKTGGSFESGGF